MHTGDFEEHREAPRIGSTLLGQLSTGGPASQLASLATTRTRKTFLHGTHRLVAPATTVHRMRPLFADLGITRIANVTGLDSIGIPVTMVVRPNSRSLACSPGKGVDLDAARASGVMEAIELHHAEHIVCPLKLASWDELHRGHKVAPVELLPQSSLGFFEPSRTLLWIEGTDLMTTQGMWVPHELVHTNFTMPFPPGTGAFVMSSNGLASGNHWLEATSHALCEVIERDAVTLFHCLSQDERAARWVDMETILDAEARRVLDLYDRAGIVVRVWDLTSDIGVPVFRCCVADQSPSPFRVLPVVEGLGCHPVREIALLRALTEAAQGRLVIIAGTRDELGRRRYTERRSNLAAWRREESLGPGTRPFGVAPTLINETFEEDVAALLDRLRIAGVEHVVAVDLSRPELAPDGVELSVIRVVVPGLETHLAFPGYIPGARARRILETRNAAVQA